MKLIIATDMEGVGGIFSTAQSEKKFTSTDKFFHCYEDARRLLTREVNAAVDGAVAGGCDEVVVWDGHCGTNFILEELDPRASYIVGGGYGTWIPMDRSINAMALVGFHAMARDAKGVLEHTQGFNVHFYSVNGIEMGEIGQAALLAGHYDIPVIFVSGDEAACAEARKLLGDEIVTVVVKKALAREAAEILAPKKCRELICDGIRRSISLIGTVKPFKLEPPYHVVSESLADRTHLLSDEEIKEGRTRFIVRREYTTDKLPLLDLRH